MRCFAECRPRSALQNPGDDLADGGLRLQADEPFLRLIAALEEQHLRNAGNAVFHGYAGMIVGVQLTDFDFPSELRGNFIDGHGRDRTRQPKNRQEPERRS